MTPRRRAASVEDHELRVLPHNLEAEKAVLGAILISERAYDLASPVLEARHFFRRAHQAIFEGIVELFDRTKGGVDLVTLKDTLARRGQLDECGGPAYIAALTDGVPRSANAQYYAAIVREKATLRDLIRMSSDLTAEAYDAEASAGELVQRADEAIIGIQRGSAPGRMVDVRQSTIKLFDDLNWRVANKGQLTGVTSGLANVDEITNGWQAGDMIVVAARPSIGKTALMLQLAKSGAIGGTAVAVFSLEMRLRQIEYRMLANLSGVDLSRILGGFVGDLDFEKLAQAMTTFSTLPIFVDDRGGQSVASIRAACRRLKSEGRLGMVIVDYVQLVHGSLERRGATRNEEITDISRRLKVLADEVSAPVFVLSQLSRAGEKEGRRPVLSDLRESGALEQDADIVAFLHRKDHRASGPTALIFEKQRNGPTGSAWLNFDRSTQTFAPGEEPEAPAKADPEEQKAKRGKVFRRR